MSELNIKVKLSTLWIIVMINMLFADIFSIMIELINKNTLDIPGEVETIMTIAAIVTNIPILMIYFSRVLKYRINRILNIVVAVFTIIYVIGGGAWAPHYILIASIEVIILLIIIRSAWKWNLDDKAV
jgi:hypothetical protein